MSKVAFSRCILLSLRRAQCKMTLAGVIEIFCLYALHSSIIMPSNKQDWNLVAVHHIDHSNMAAPL